MEKAYNIDPVAVEVPVPIQTRRLLLRPYQAGDGKMLAQGVAETWDDLYQWFHTHLSHKDQETNPLFKEVWAEARAASFVARKELRFIILDVANGKFIGTAGLINPNWRVRCFELDYWVTKSAQGQGFAVEAAQALLVYAFDALRARVVTVGHAAGNEASKKVIEKLGFQHAIRKPYDYEMPDGTLVDGHGYYRENTDNLPPLEVTWPCNKN